MERLRDSLIAGVLAITLTPVLLASLPLTFAQVMSSTNYQIRQDSINIGGGLSTSTNYAVESTSGEVGTGDSTSTNYALRAGYQQLDTTFISIGSIASVVMTPVIAGVTGGTANGSTTVVVTTDSPAGYGLSIAAADSPALRSGPYTIDDYVPVGNPDFSFVTNPADAHFGYSPEGADIVARFRDNTSVCGTGSSDTSLACWDGLSTSDTSIAQSSGPNVPNGTPTVLHFRTGIGASAFQESGIYTATTTVTALAL
jgi:hypothetical protein